MSKDNNIEKYLPLSESTYFILLNLVEPLHGYGLMQSVEEMTDGKVSIGPGTLYGAFLTLEKEGLIEMVRKENRRKLYMLTDKGRATLHAQIKRLEMMTHKGQQVISEFRNFFPSDQDE
jgi:DNA-binding PadR family transcriptional regulator